jgi:mRNA-degrading endonuclease YafQ of YafQ-DinJ toxin-antitoxin module
MQKENVIKHVHFTPHFLRAFQKLPPSIRELAQMKDKRFRHNPFEPSLRTHQLKGQLAGAWFYSVNYDYRIVFRCLSNEEVICHDIGTHDIYK